MIALDDNGHEVYKDTYDYMGYEDVANDVVVDENMAYVTGKSYNGSNYDCLTIAYYLNDGSVIWTDTINSGYRATQSGDYGEGIAVDSSGYLHVTGYYDNGTDYDYFTVKYNNSNKIWMRTYNSGGDDEAYDISTDKYGYIYVTGLSQGLGEYTIKYDSDGNVVWNTSNNLYPRTLTVDTTGNIYVEGYIIVGGSRYPALSKYIVNYDIGISSIASLDTCSVGQNYTPEAWIKNNSFSRTITDIQVTANIDSNGTHIYANQRTVGGISPRDSVLVSFDTWNSPLHSDTFNLVFSISNQDMVPENNTRGCPLYILDIVDAALPFIASSDSVYIDSSYTPSVWVKNNSYSTTINNLSILANIDSQGIHIYSDEKTVSGLAPGDSILVDFQSWTAPSHSGQFTLKFSIIADNANPDNDTISKPLYVGDFIDAEILRIVSGDTAYIGRPYIPKVWIKNNSRETTLNNLSISTNIDSQGVHIFSEQKTLSSISPGDSTLVSFDAWTAPSHSGTFTLSFSILNNDYNTDNNTKSENLLISDIDAAVYSIASSDSVDMDSIYVPEVWVSCNDSGVRFYRVEVQAEIDSADVSVYTSQKSVDFGDVRLKEDKLVSFDAWTAPSHSGQFTLKFSIITDNANPDNDTISKPLYVGDFIDAEVLRIASGDTAYAGRPYIPKVWIKNNSRETTLNNLSISTNIDSQGVHIFSEQKTLSSISPGDSALASFDAWTPPSHSGTFTLSFSILNNDYNTDNNTKSKNLVISDVDAAVYSIASSDSVDMDSIYVPEVWVSCNDSGVRFYRVEVQAEIDSADVSVYTSQKSVDFGDVRLKEDKLVSFDAWTAPSHSGQFTLKFSIITDNANPDNDTISKPLYVGDFIDAEVLRIASGDTAGINSTYTPMVWIKNNSFETVLSNMVTIATIDSDSVHIYQDQDTIQSLGPGDSTLVSFDTWTVPSHPDTFKLKFAILTSDMNPDNDTISKPLYVADLTPPVMDSAIAYDGSNAISGIDNDDYVVIYFSEPTNKPTIDNSNIDSVLTLSSGHTWLDGSGYIGDCSWNSDGTELHIEFTSNSALPTISVQDTIFPDSFTITDLAGNPCTSSVILRGSFDPSGIASNKLINKTYLSVSKISGRDLTLEYGIKGMGEYSIGVYSIDGRMVRLIKGAGEGKHRVRITDIPSGIYFIRLIHNDEAIDKKVMITK